METKTPGRFCRKKMEKKMNVRDFIRKNYEPYDGDECFLANRQKRQKSSWGELQKLQKKRREQGGVLNMETGSYPDLLHIRPVISTRYEELEKVVGRCRRIATDVHSCHMAESRWQSRHATYGYEQVKELHHIYTEYHKTHTIRQF